VQRIEDALTQRAGGDPHKPRHNWGLQAIDRGYLQPADCAQGTAGTGQAPQAEGWLAKWWAPATRSTSSPVAPNARAGAVRRAQAQKLQA
jgi:hypothetical protein